MFWEILIGGGGHIFEFKNIALRPILFAVTSISTFYILMYNQYKIRSGTFRRLFFLSSLLIFYMIVGIVGGNPFEAIIVDVKPFLLLLLLIILLDFRRYHQPHYMIKIIIFSSLVISVSIFILLFSQYFQLISFPSLYIWGMTTRELLFRGNEGLFFYKAVYVVCSGLLILITKKRRSNIEWLYVTIFTLAILVTLTKGLVLCVAFTAILFFIFRRKFISILLMLLLGCTILIPLVLLRKEIDQSGISLSTRVLDFNYVVENTTFISFFLGNGFGSEIRGRLAVENSYIWIWWKLGVFPIIGLLVFLLQSLSYFKRSRTGLNRLSDSFMSIIVFVFCISLINPLLSNVIGLTLLFISFIGLKHLPKEIGFKNA